MMGAIVMRETEYTDWASVPLVLTIVEAAELMNVHRNTVINMIKDGRLRGAKVGREWRVTKDAILDVLGEGE